MQTLRQEAFLDDDTKQYWMELGIREMRQEKDENQ